MVFFDMIFVMELIIYALFGFIAFFVFYRFYTDKDKSIFLYFDSKNIVSIKKSEVRSGQAKIGDRIYPVDLGVFPKSIKWGWIFKGLRPFFMIYHDNIVPIEFDEKSMKMSSSNVDPKTLNDLQENQTLRLLLSPSVPRGQLIMNAMLFLAIGIMAGYILHRIIPF